MAVPAYAVLGAAGCTRLVELAGPISRAVADAGLLNIPKSMAVNAD